MKKRHNTPGVYVEEVSIFPNSIAQVETAIPAFVGYSEKAVKSSDSLHLIPTKIESISEYEILFGRAFLSKFEIVSALAADPFPLKVGEELKSISFLPNQQSFLYPSVKAFFGNGGSACYIVSVGCYSEQNSLVVQKSDLLNGLSALESEELPSMIVVPDAVSLADHAFDIYKAMLAQAKAKFRFAILDIPNGFSPTSNECISTFRTGIGQQNLSFGAAYFPWINSNFSLERDVDILNHLPFQVLQEILPEEHAQSFLNATPSPAGDYLHQGLKGLSKTYQELLKIIQERLRLLPPSGFLAGAFSQVDEHKGVWKAPANVSLNYAKKTTSLITNTIQEKLTTHPSGKSINAIREFPGKGVLIFGARTLAGNDNEWRYISVRRTFSMIEQSLRDGLKYVAFEANERKTWNTIKINCSAFLTELWRKGGLAGAKPEEAFFVKVGLGETMSNQDVLDHKLIVEIGMALVRPAEFMFLRISLKVGGS